MLKKALKLILKFIIFLFLTALTQIGGVLYVLIEFFTKKDIRNYRLKKSGIFLMVYLVATFIVVPIVAPIFGRVKLKDTEQIEACTFFTKLLNRNYVKPELNDAVIEIANVFENRNTGIKLVYLDANFPFMNGFPLLPHLSHNDGEKVDISFVYNDNHNRLTNKKPSISGYGVFEAPTTQEYNQIQVCKQKGAWQYDMAQYITFGTVNKELKFSQKATKDLLLAIVNQKQINKVFIEPHLKNRLGVVSPKIRFHGCQAVRHDDHIHLQLK